MTTQKIETPTKTTLRSLQATLEQAERQFARLDGSNIKTFLLLLDQIDRMFGELGRDESTLRAEMGRWSSLLSRIDAKPQFLLSAAAHAGGLAKLRSQNPPATGPWWHVDARLTHQRAQTMKRVSITLAAVVVAAALVFWGVNAFTPAAGSSATTATQIEQLVTAQNLPAAQAVVTKALQTTPTDPELLVWDAVLNEQLGNAAQAKASLAQAQQKFVGQPAAFWTMVGNHRQQVGNLAGAEQAGQQALALAPQDANVTLLLGSIAEARGDTVQAAHFFSQTVTLAGNANPQLVVIAKMRLGNLSQQVGALPSAQTITQTLPAKAP